MIRGLLAFSIFFLLLSSCKSDLSGQYTYAIPNQMEDGLSVALLDDVNMNGELIAQAVTKIRRGKFKEVHSILIFKDGKLVLEEYFKGHKYRWDGPGHHGELVNWEEDMLHVCQSVTKSITSTCIGIAIDRGFIGNVHQSIFDYLPEHQHLRTEGKDKITIEHLVTMTSGLKWDEWKTPLSSSANDIVGLWFPPCQDPVTCVLERPLQHEPGTSYTYSGGGMIVLGEIIRNATNMKMDEFSRKYLFEPLGIDSSHWALEFENGVLETAGGLKLTPRDMTKVGVTFLNSGMWNEKRIISESWVENSATAFPGNQWINIPGVDSGRKNGYSYSWWITSQPKSGKKVDMYNAGGWGGQEVMVIPELNTVVVFTGGNYQSKVRVYKILRKYILPAIGE